jgi:hypothetical protein
LIGYQKILCIIFVVFAIVVLVLGVHFRLWQFSDITPYILAPIFAGISAAIFFIFKPSNNTGNQQISSIISQNQPRLNYVDKEIRVKKWNNYTGGTKFHYSNYYLKIENTARGIEAKECKGKITVSNTDIETREMLWESRKPNISIGHEELLRLFEISETSERRTILFHRDRLEFNEGMNEKKISVKIQSENAECPTKAFEAKVGDIIKNAH